MSVSLNKSHVAENMARIGIDGEEIAKSHAEKYLDLALEGIIATMEQAKNNPPNKKGIRAKLTMVGFGSFDLRHVPDRNHRNPQTQEPVLTPAHNTIKFNEGKAFEGEIN
jgi:nucleoid DNA-binding protein